MFFNTRMECRHGREVYACQNGSELLLLGPRGRARCLVTPFDPLKACVEHHAIYQFTAAKALGLFQASCLIHATFLQGQLYRRTLCFHCIKVPLCELSRLCPLPLGSTI